VLVIANANDLLHRNDEDFSVANLAFHRDSLNGLDGFFEERLLIHDVDSNAGDQSVSVTSTAK
jgi:hypothetical protein